MAEAFRYWFAGQAKGAPVTLQLPELVSTNPVLQVTHWKGLDELHASQWLSGPATITMISVKRQNIAKKVGE